MRVEFEGMVVSHNIDSGKHPYAVIEVTNSLHLNYRIFIPSTDLTTRSLFRIRDKVKIIVETKNHQEKKDKKEKEPNNG